MIEQPKCSKRRCIHFLGVKNDGDETTERNYCMAYPNEIPTEIAYGKDKHTELRGDEVVLVVYEEEAK